MSDPRKRLAEMFPNEQERKVVSELFNELFTELENDLLMERAANEALRAQCRRLREVLKTVADLL